MEYTEEVDKYRNCFLSKDGFGHNKQMKDLLLYKYKQNNKTEKIKNANYILSFKGFDISENLHGQACIVIKKDNPYCDLVDKTLKSLSSQGSKLKDPYDFFPLFWYGEDIGGYVLGLLLGYFPGTLVVF